jgi:hypothetical protein
MPATYNSVYYTVSQIKAKRLVTRKWNKILVLHMTLWHVHVMFVPPRLALQLTQFHSNLCRQQHSVLSVVAELNIVTMETQQCFLYTLDLHVVVFFFSSSSFGIKSLQFNQCQCAHMATEYSSCPVHTSHKDMVCIGSRTIADV